MKRLLLNMQGYTLDSSDGEIGRCEDFLIEDRPWVVRYLVVHTGSWLFGRRVLIPLPALRAPDDNTRTIRVALAREEIKTSKPVSEDPPVSSGIGERSYLYYGWPSTAAGTPEDATPMNTAADDPNRSFLRSAAEMARYALVTGEVPFGAVRDFIIDPALWAVRYLVASVKNNGESKRILIPVDTVTRVDWPNQRIETAFDIHGIPGYPAHEENAGVLGTAAENALLSYLADNMENSNERPS